MYLITLYLSIFYSLPLIREALYVNTESLHKVKWYLFISLNIALVENLKYRIYKRTISFQHNSGIILSWQTNRTTETENQ